MRVTRNCVRPIGLSVGAVALLLVMACASGPSGKVTYHDSSMDFGLVRSVAVLPFDNLTNETGADERVRDVFMVMLQATGAMYVLPPGEVTRGVQRAGIANPTAPTAEEVLSLAQIVEADVIITGTVREFGQTRSGSTTANTVSVSVSMLEGQTGRLVWSASSTKGGVSTGDRVFGGGGRPMDIVVSKAVDDLLDKLFR